MLGVCTLALLILFVSITIAILQTNKEGFYPHRRRWRQPYWYDGPWFGPGPWVGPCPGPWCPYR
jgi:hypothetical protein